MFMKERLEIAGFTVKLLEYWNENGNFILQIGATNGKIWRSRRYDERNRTMN